MQKVSKSAAKSTKDLFLASYTPKGYKTKKKNKNTDCNGDVCWYERRSGDIEAECFDDKYDKARNDERKDAHEELMVTLATSRASRKELALTAHHSAFVDCRTAAHMVRKESMSTGITNPSDAIIGNTVNDITEAKTQQESVVNRL